jgi:hypothetical protein
MIRKPIASINESDFTALIDNEVPEGRTIEYKRDLPADTRDAKNEFLNDVLSFANSSGGDLIFGMEETSGVPTTITGVDVKDPDALGLRFENICRDSVEPRIQPLQINVVPLSSGRSIVLVRVVQSWQAPHRNRLNGAFTARNSRGKYPMDVSELRAAFLNSSSLEQRVKQFREDRSKVIMSGLVPRPLRDGIAVVLHIVPVESMLGERRLDLNSKSNLLYKFRPMGHISGFSVGVNLEGAVAYDGSEMAYTQLFRSGQVEAVFVYPDHHSNTKALYGDFENHVRQAASIYLAELRQLDFSGPIAMMLSIHRAKDSYLHTGATQFNVRRTNLETIQTPDILLQDEGEVEERVGELFEIIWNAYGHTRPKDYQPR